LREIGLSLSIVGTDDLNIDEINNDNILINVNINLSVFNTKIYKYVSRIQNNKLLEMNHNTLSEIITKCLNYNGKSNIVFKINRMNESIYL
jgi:Na+/phosphate symporter